MSNKILSIALIGKNRIGLISDLTRYMYNEGANIQKSRMIGYNSSFIISLEADVPKNFHVNNIKSNFKNDINMFDTESVNQLSNLIKLDNKNTYNASISINLSDTPGIIHNTASILSENNININELQSDVDIAAFSNIPLFKLYINAAVPKKLHIGDLYSKITNDTNLLGSIEIKSA
tara:strand:- start:88 stop:618 length:531 start_codon:yes stop_codon:yes gene_type:complete